MRKIGYFMFAATLITFSGCKDDIVEQNTIEPAQTGDVISFGSSLANAGSRTIYDDEVTVGEDGTSYYRVSWENNDEIAIYCPQAADTKLADYRITPKQDNPTTSSLVTNVSDDEILRWGSENTHHFYGFYPASVVTGEEDGKIKGTVPATQNVTEWKYDEATKTWIGTANTDYAFMWAYGSADRNSTVGTNHDVSLKFHPWMTILEIEINGPKDGGSLKVSNINVRAIEGTESIITGDFVCDMTPVENAENKDNANPVYIPVGDTEGQSRNTISISGWNPATNDFIELNPGEKMVVRAFLLPIDEEKTEGARNLQVRVQPLNGAVLTRTLGYSGTNPGATVAPHKVNKVILPPLQSAGTNLWMSSLDERIYLSELSIPGSKFSYLYGNNVGEKAAFQASDIKTQFMDGVRAFIVQVGANATYRAQRGDWHWSFGGGYYDYDYTYVSGNSTMPIFCGNGKNLSDAITEIAEALAEVENMNAYRHECAVVMITYSGGGEVSVNFTGDDVNEHSISDIPGTQDKVWMDVIADVLPQLGQTAANRIWTEEITANTTLADVAGKIILKVNTNSDAQADYIAADGTVPALFSRWNGAMGTVNLQWGTLNPNTSRPKLHWMYQEATHVGEGTEITATDKVAYIEDVFTNSVTAYQNNDAHDTWFMNDCGGTFHGEVVGAGSYDGKYGDGDTNDDAPIALSRWINPQVTQFLQERGANAALGLVFFNFADKQPNSGQEYGTDNLIQTIIDNNFKFNLRMRGNSATNSASHDAAYSQGGNVWD